MAKVKFTLDRQTDGWFLYTPQALFAGGGGGE